MAGDGEGIAGRQVRSVARGMIASLRGKHRSCSIGVFSSWDSWCVYFHMCSCLGTFFLVAAIVYFDLGHFRTALLYCEAYDWHLLYIDFSLC